MIVEFDLFKELQVVLDVSLLKSAFIQFGREICPQNDQIQSSDAMVVN